MNKKVLAISIVAILAVSSVGGYMIFDALYGNHNHSSNHDPEGREFVSDYAGGYFDVVDAKTVSICTVEDNPADSTSANNAAAISCKSGGSSAAMMPAGANVYTTGVSYEGFHNELQKSVNGLENERVEFYSDSTDMDGENNQKTMENWNIVYLERCGSLYFMAFIQGGLEGIYSCLMYENFDVWFNESQIRFYMVDVYTGKIFGLTGIWLGTTGWRYSGTNNLIPSVQYMGSYGGEEYFKVNVECNRYNAQPIEGEFTNIEGVVAFKSDGENLTHRNVLIDDDPWYKTYVGPGDGEDKFQQIPGKTRKFGYEMKLYDNGLIRYVLNTTFPAMDPYWPGMDSGDTYIQTVNGESIMIGDTWVECCNYLCRSVDFYNTYFPTSMETYDSDGSIKVIDCNVRSYEMASNNHYDGCIYREIGDTSTSIYILNVDGTIDKLVLKNTREYELYENIFGSPVYLKPRVFDHQYPFGGNFTVYNSEVYYETINWSYSTLSETTGLIVLDHLLYVMTGDVMKEYNFRTGVIRDIPVPADSVAKVRVSEEGGLYVEGYKEDLVCKLDLGDGGFQYSRSSVQVMTLKKVIGNGSGES